MYYKRKTNINKKKVLKFGEFCEYSYFCKKYHRYSKKKNESVNS